MYTGHVFCPVFSGIVVVLAYPCFDGQWFDTMLHLEVVNSNTIVEIKRYQIMMELTCKMHTRRTPHFTLIMICIMLNRTGGDGKLINTSR